LLRGKVKEVAEDEGKVRVVEVDMAKRTVCCAPIGGMGQRVCIAPLTAAGICSKFKTHKGVPDAWKATGGTLYVIPESYRSPDVACLAPFLSKPAVSKEDRESFRIDEKTVAKWSVCFSAIIGKGGEEGRAMSPERAALMTKTPIKLALASNRRSPLKIDLVSMGLDEPSDRCVAALVQDIQKVNDAIFDVGSDRMGAERNQSAALARIADRLNMVQAELGDRGSTMVPTLWAGLGTAQDAAQEALNRSKVEVEKVRAENEVLHGLVSRQSTELRAAETRAALIADRLEALEGRVILTDKRVMTCANLLRGAEGPRAPAPEDGLRALARRIELLEGSGVPGRGGGDGGDTCRFTLERSAELTRLGNHVSALELAIESDSVSVGQVVLKDLEAAKAYAVKASLPDEAEAFLGVAHLAVQPLLLLDLVHAVKLAPETNTITKIKNQQTVGMTDFEMVAAKSISNLIPAMFGNGLQTDELSALPTYDSFHEPGVIHGSLLDLVMTGITDVEAAVNQQVEDAQIGASAKLMLATCLAESKVFVIQLFAFMRLFHERYALVLPPKEVWAILQLLVRAILQDLRGKMTAASGVKWGDTHRSPFNAGKLLWATFQVLKTARTYVRDYAAGWEGHPTLSPAINKFLLKNVVMKPTLAVFMADLEQVKKDAADAKRPADAARGAAARGQGDAAKKANKDKPNA
jgi:hypothetical protein